MLFALVLIAPWPFGCEEPPFEAALAAGVLLLTTLWAAHAAWTERLSVRLDVVTLALTGLAGWTAVQLIPLPESVVGVVCPARLDWHRTLLPERLEALPGEAIAVARPSTLPFSVDPSATRTFLAQLLGALLVYLAARNWLATRDGFRRLAWVLAASGTLLAVFAVCQKFSSPDGTLYWSVRVNTEVFGPFVCRNHYPDYVAPCLGAAVGLLLPRQGRSAGGYDPAGRRSVWVPTPATTVLLAAAGLMAASIALSLSRGGVVAAVGAAAGAVLLTRVGPGRGSAVAGLLTLGGTAAVAGGLFAWLGSDRVEARLATLAGPTAADSRGPIWRGTARLVPPFWAVGTGGGTFVWTEPVTRRELPASYVVEHAHNEYLEAAVEGGVVRLALTGLLAGGVLVAVGSGYLARRDRSVGPLLLGAWFGLAVGVLHAAVDFAAHLPAVAVTTAAVAGYAMAAARDSVFAPPRGQAVPSGGDDRRSLRGAWAAVGGLGLAALAAFVGLDTRSREQAYRLKLAADLVPTDGSPERHERRTAYLDARATVRPDDTAALFDAAQGHLDAAGGAAPDRLPPDVVARHVVPALRLLRAARAANPTAPRPHTRLALYAGYFQTAEPAAAHFDRAKRLLPADPDLWYHSGRHALARGDEATAWADWRRSLELSDRHLPAVLTTAGRRMPLTELCGRVLPADPAMVLAAADRLAPAGGGGGRGPFLDRVITMADPSNPAHLAAAARAHDELGHVAEAGEAWRRAAELAPDDARVRDGYCRWLEQDERYEEAVVELSWLRQRGSAKELQDRLDAATHGLKLRRGIGRR